MSDFIELTAFEFRESNKKFNTIFIRKDLINFFQSINERICDGLIKSLTDNGLYIPNREVIMSGTYILTSVPSSECIYVKEDARLIKDMIDNLY